jgi:hypothetical protein
MPGGKIVRCLEPIIERIAMRKVRVEEREES